MPGGISWEVEVWTLQTYHLLSITGEQLRVSRELSTSSLPLGA